MKQSRAVTSNVILQSLQQRISCDGWSMNRNNNMLFTDSFLSQALYVE